MDDSKDKKKGTGVGAAAGAVAGGVAGGAAAGAAVGGMTGPVCAAVGAAVGAVVGAVGGRGAGAAKDAHDDGKLGTSSHEGRRLQTVIGAFDDPSAAQRAVDRLTQSGFDRDDIHVQQHQQGQAGNPSSNEGRNEGFFHRLLGADDAGQGMQGNQHAHQAALYEEAVRRGNAIVVVDSHDHEQAGRASRLLHELGAVDVDERAKQWRTEGWNPRPQGLQGKSVDMQERDGKLDVVQEELQVGKREVDRGGVRVVQRMSQEPVREIVRLREEHARVERRPVDRPASPDELNNLGQGTVEIRERAEVPVVGKTARVVEEVSVGKEVREHDETIEDTVRRKDVEIERLEGNDRATRDERAFAADPNRERMLREEQDRASPPRSPMDPDKPR